MVGGARPPGQGEGRLTERDAEANNGQKKGILRYEQRTDTRGDARLGCPGSGGLAGLLGGRRLVTPLKESRGADPQQTQQQTRLASHESETRPADDGPAAGAQEDRSPEDLAGDTQTRRLAVENVLQVGGFGCVSCQAVVEGILQEADGVEKATYEPRTDTYLVRINDDFRMGEVAGRVRSISKEYNRRLGLPDSPAWVLKEA